MKHVGSYEEEYHTGNHLDARNLIDGNQVLMEIAIVKGDVGVIKEKVDELS